MSNAFNLSQLANFVNSSGQVNAATGLYNTGSIGFASGTRMSFQQTSAPTGWTKDTTAAINDSILRLVTGAVTPSGGSVGFSTWNTSGTSGATTLSTAQMPSHSHFLYSAPESGGPNTGVGNVTQTNSSSGGNLTYTGGGGSHTHSLSNNIKYYDFIIASKD